MSLSQTKSCRDEYRQQFHTIDVLKEHEKSEQHHRPAPGKPRILVGERKSLLIFIPSFVVTFTVLTVVSGFG
jgi:hypothetical protein